MFDRLSKNLVSGCSKRSRCEAREKSTSEGVFTDTLERGDRAQRSRWAFFNSLLQDDTHGSMLAQRFQIENGFPVMDLQLSVYPF